MTVELSWNDRGKLLRHHQKNGIARYSSECRTTCRDLDAICHPLLICRSNVTLTLHSIMSLSGSHQTIPLLTMNEMLKAVPHRTFTTSQRRSRAKMEEAISDLPQDKYDLLCGAAVAKKRRLNPEPSPSSLPTRSIETEPQTPTEDHRLFETVSEECRQKCIADFIDATGSNAVASSICAVCAGTFFNSDLEQVLLSYLRESEKLIPTTFHPSHILIEGMLLHHNPLCYSRDPLGQTRANVCTSCTASLRLHKTPPLSLANGMWIGDVPLVLRVLTLPERILVALFFLLRTLSNSIPKKRGHVRGQPPVYTAV